MLIVQNCNPESVDRRRGEEDSLWKNKTIRNNLSDLGDEGHVPFTN